MKRQKSVRRRMKTKEEEEERLWIHTRHQIVKFLLFATAHGS